MWRFWLGQAMRFGLGLAGAVLLAAALLSLAAPGSSFGSSLGSSIGPSFGSTFVRHVAGVLAFSFGPDVLTGRPATAGLGPQFAASLELVGIGALIALVIGAPLGIALGIRPVLRAGSPLIQIVAAAPVFCASLALIWVAVNVLGWDDIAYAGNDPLGSLLVSGSGHAGLAQAWRAFSIPVLTVGLAGAATVQVVIRRATSQAYAEPYRQSLRLMGLSPFEIDRHYVAPPVLAHLCASFGEIYLALLSAAAIAEWIFGWPGAISRFLHAVALHDWSVAAAILFVLVTAKFACDVAGKIFEHALMAPGAVR